MEKISCSLERMIGFIMEINGIAELQFVIYVQRRLCRQIQVDERFVFAYGENELRRLFSLLPPGESVYPDWLETLGTDYGKTPEENVGLTSIVRLKNGKIKHIPMIDFGCACSDSNLREVEKTLSNLGERKGFVLESGMSYHYYGLKLLIDKEWREFMEECKKQPAVDINWPSYQIADKFSVLRVFVSTSKPNLPKVVAKIGKFKF